MELIDVDVTNDVAVLTLNEPDKRNALSLAMNDEIGAALDELEAGGAKALIVTGAAPAFCAGANLGELLGSRSADGVSKIYDGFLRVAHTPLPTIAAVNGAAVGAGMNMALACDVIMAGESAKFDTRFLQIGIHPGGGHTWRLQNITDRQTANAMVLFGQIVRGPEAARRGLVWDCLPDDELLDACRAMAERAASFPPAVTASTKATIRSMSTVDDSMAAVHAEVGPQAESMQSGEFQALVKSLQAKISSKD